MPTRANAAKPVSTKKDTKGSKTVKGTSKPASVTKGAAASTSKGGAAAAPAAKVKPVEVTKVNIKRIGPTVLADADDKIIKAGKAALLVDNESNNAQTLMRYGNQCVLVDEVKTAKPEVIIQGVLHGMKNNMPCMAHIEDAEAFGMMKEKLDKVHPGFLASCMDRSIVETEKIKEVQDKSGEVIEHLEYTSKDERNKFFFGVLADKNDYNDELKGQFTCFEVEEQD